MLKLRRLAAPLAVAATFALPAAALSHSVTAGTLVIGHPWSRPTPEGAPTAAGFLTLTNKGPEPDRLLGGEAPDIAKIEIHQMSMDGGVMRMRPVAGGLTIAPGAKVKLAPGGYHLMLIGPKRPFKAGDMIPATLRFEHAGAVRIEFKVEATDPKGSEHDHKGLR